MFSGKLLALAISLRLAQAAGGAAEEPAGVVDQQVVHVDHGLPVGALADDRDIEEHAVGEDVIHRVLAGLLAGRADPELGDDQREAVVAVLLPVDVHVARLEAREDLAARDGHREEVLLALEAAGQLGEHLVGFLVDPDVVEALAVGRADDALEALADRLPVLAVRAGLAAPAAAGHRALDGAEVDVLAARGGLVDRVGRGVARALAQARLRGRGAREGDRRAGDRDQRGAGPGHSVRLRHR
jgi:hypothetical protein